MSFASATTECRCNVALLIYTYRGNTNRASARGNLVEGPTDGEIVFGLKLATGGGGVWNVGRDFVLLCQIFFERFWHYNITSDNTLRGLFKTSYNNNQNHSVKIN